MKKFIFFLNAILLICLFGSCQNQDKNLQWEYKVIAIGEELSLQEKSNKVAQTLAGISNTDAALSINFDNPQSQLNDLGQEGWELVATYSTIETLFPNYGDKEMHTGIKSNTRTQKVCFVFKRPLKNEKEDPNSSK